MRVRWPVALVITLLLIVPTIDAGRPRVPEAPTLSATASDMRVGLTWEMPSGSSAPSGYRLYRGPASGSMTLLATLGATETAYADFAVENGATYRYAVSAFNKRGESPLSNVVTATPTAPAVRSPGTIVFTFDDTSSYDLTAARMLEEHGRRGTFYLVSGYLGTGSLQLSRSDVVSLQARGHDIESHSATHPDLTTLSDTELRRELADSKAALEGILGAPVRHFAYPYGAYDARVVAATRLVYQSARTADGSMGVDDRYLAPGVVIDRATSVATAKSYVDAAIRDGLTLIFLFERITPTPGQWDWTPTQFEELLDHVDARGPAVKTVDEVLAATAPPVRVPGRVVLTFDDGYISSLDAATILENHGRAGTFFVSTGLLRTTATGSYLSASEVRGLAARGMDIEAHTISHVDLTTVSDAQLRRELVIPQMELQNLTGKPVRHFAYPYDAFDARVIEATKLVYDSARTVDGDIGNPDPYRVPGVPVVDATSVATVKGYVDFATSNDQTLVLVFHRITYTPLEYDWTPPELDELLRYLDTRGVAVQTIAEAYG